MALYLSGRSFQIVAKPRQKGLRFADCDRLGLPNPSGSCVSWDCPDTRIHKTSSRTKETSWSRRPILALRDVHGDPQISKPRISKDKAEGRMRFGRAVIQVRPTTTAKRQNFHVR